MTKAELDLVFVLIRVMDVVATEVLSSKKIKKHCGKKSIKELKEQHKKLQKKFRKMVKKSRDFDKILTEVEETKVVIKLNKLLEKYKRFTNDIQQLASNSGN